MNAKDAMNCHCDYCGRDNKRTPDLIDLVVKWLHNKWDVRDLLHYWWGYDNDNQPYAEISIKFRNRGWYLIRITLPDKLSVYLDGLSEKPHVSTHYDWSSYYNISNKEDWEYVEDYMVRIMKYIGIGEINEQQNASI